MSVNDKAPHVTYVSKHPASRKASERIAAWASIDELPYCGCTYDGHGHPVGDGGAVCMSRALVKVTNLKAGSEALLCLRCAREDVVLLEGVFAGLADIGLRVRRLESLR